MEETESAVWGIAGEMTALVAAIVFAVLAFLYAPGSNSTFIGLCYGFLSFYCSLKTLLWIVHYGDEKVDSQTSL